MKDYKIRIKYTLIAFQIAKKCVKITINSSVYLENEILTVLTLFLSSN